MIALGEHLRNNGHDEKHTHTPGIWEKLRSLYNMDMIDEREKPFDDEEGMGPFIDFELPEEEFGELMFLRGQRGPSEAQSSPAVWNPSPSPRPTSSRRRRQGDTATTKTRASTVEDTDEVRTSPPRSPPAKTTRVGRSTTRSQVRAKAKSTSRAPSKETTMDEDDGENETEETADDDEQDDEQEAEEEERSASPRPTRGTSKAKADAGKATNRSRKSKRKR